MHSESTTDLSVIYSQLKTCKSDRENVVFISTGAMNPIHRSHISNMIQTKRYFENVYQLNVLTGYISPSHDQYVQNKLGKDFIPSLQRFLNENVKLDKPIRVIYVAGLDLFNRCKGMFGLRQAHMGGVAVVYRHGEDTSLIKRLINEDPSKIYFIPLNKQNENQFNNIGSTLIRQKLQINEDCSHLTYKSVLEYLIFTQLNTSL